MHNRDRQSAAAVPFPGNGEVARLLREHDWSDSALGQPDTWPHALRNLSALMLQSTFPMFVAWGEQHCLIYNDAYATLMQDRHPSGIGRPFREVWSDIWSDCLPLIERAYAGHSSFIENFPLTMLRQGREDQTYFTFSYSPARGDDNAIAGLFCVCTETTAQVLNEQRQSRLLELADQLRDLRDPGQILRTSAEFLSRHLSLTGATYLEIEPEQRRVRETARWPDRHGRGHKGAWQPLHRYLDTEALQRLTEGESVPVDRVPAILQIRDLPTAHQDRSTDACLIVPLKGNGQLKATLNLLHRRPSSLGSGEISFAIEVAERAMALASGARAEGALTDRIAAEADHLRNLFEQTPGFVAVMRGPDHRFEMANNAYLKLVGDRQVIGRTVREVLPDIEGQGFFEILDQVYASGEPYVANDVPLSLEDSPGEVKRTVYVDFVYQPIVEPDGSLSGIFAAGSDVTLRRQALEELKTSEKHLKVALEAAGGGTWDWNLRTGELVLSASWKAMMGYSDTRAPDVSHGWQNLIHPDDLSQVLTDFRRCIEGRTATANSECRIRCSDGSWQWVLNRGGVAERDADGLPKQMIGASIDISEKKESAQQIWQRANFDALTGLPNRSLFRDRLDHEVRQSQAHGDSFALMVIDLDHFKEINDLLGHSVGDMFLSEAAQRITACTRRVDTVARLGGDEFTVILSGVAEGEHVELMAQKIIDQLTQPFQIDGEVAYASGSIGITLFPQDAAEADELIRNAEQSMYTAKQSGGNRFAFFNRAMQRSAAARLKLISDLRHALPEDQLCLHYQPIVDLATGEICKAEALIRWHHPTKGLIPPSEFIPIAEETGMIHEIGNWVFMQAAISAKAWSRKLGRQFQISVNKSPLQFMAHSKMPELNWADHLVELGADSSSISVEITEGVLLNASPGVQSKLNGLQASGIQVAIDDFGTGYSSMSYLKKYDIDFLKIDQSFVRDMATDPTSQTIVETIIVMAHKLGLEVIAEGIETPEQREWLQAVGCEFGQGFHFSEPVPLSRFEALLGIA